ncbi:MAG: site-specific integrase [Thermoplasmatales archaeon]|nr:site-specific integrase [Thermoplasmatales archaeon]
MTIESKYDHILKDETVERWYKNLKARSNVTSSVYVRYLGYYCDKMKTNPEKILSDAKDKKLKNQFEDFVRSLEEKGRAGSYITKYKKVLKSWLKYNDVDAKLNVNIKGENDSPTVADERIPTKDELSRILRSASQRGRVAISLMAFSGLRPESLGNYDGTDGLKLGDIKELKLSRKIEFEKVPAQIEVRTDLSKVRHRYFTFLGPEGITYVKEYLEERMKKGEKLNSDSPLIQLDLRAKKTHSFMRTMLVTRDIREAIVSSNLDMRPYVMRAYFATQLDIAESKGIISHPWRMFIMGHKGDIESRYSTNKRLSPEMVEQIREVYKKCLPFIETIEVQRDESDQKRFVQSQLLQAVGYTQEDIGKINLDEISNEDFQKMLRNKLLGAMENNGRNQKIVPANEVGAFIEKGWEYVSSIPGDKAIIKLPERL